MPHVSDTAAGLIMIGCGLGMLWAGGAYVQTRAEVRLWMRWRMRHLGRWRWWHNLLLPKVHPRPELISAYVLSAAAIAAGVVVLLR
jgi:hypothetical protein